MADFDADFHSLLGPIFDNIEEVPEAPADVPEAPVVSKPCFIARLPLLKNSEGGGAGEEVENLGEHMVLRVSHHGRPDRWRDDALWHPRRCSREF